MTNSLPTTNLQLQSCLTPDGEVRLRLVTIPLAPPAADEVIIRVEAAPINPSDVGAMIGPADVSRARVVGAGDDMEIVIPVPPAAMSSLSGRVGQPTPSGIEGAGVVVAAGSSSEAQALVGKVVALSAGAMYSQYRVANTADLLATRDGTTPVEAASALINPLTALGMVETMRREGHTALVHTAAASNLGQMLNRICLADGVPIVNIVRRRAQVEILTELGAEHVVDSSAASFMNDLTAAIEATNATVCFDVIGGGKLASQVLTAMETVQLRKLSGYHRYGSEVHKQVYISGLLDRSPTELSHTYGQAWGVAGWWLTSFLSRIGPDVRARLRDRVASELTTTFASHYTKTISLREALDPAVIIDYHRRATGEKYLIAPHL